MKVVRIFFQESSFTRMESTVCLKLGYETFFNIIFLKYVVKKYFIEVLHSYMSYILTDVE